LIKKTGNNSLKQGSSTALIVAVDNKQFLAHWTAVSHRALKFGDRPGLFDDF